MTATSTPTPDAEQPAPPAQPAPAPTPPPAPATAPAPAPSAPQPGQYYYGLGRRKCAIAQVRLFPSGDGQVIVNGRPSREYFGREALDIVLRQPLSAVEGSAYNVVAKVIGGGLTGQAGAIRLGIARALARRGRAEPARPPRPRAPDPGRQGEGAQEAGTQAGSSR